MSELVKGFQTTEGTKKYDFDSLANVPNVIKSEANLNEFIQSKIAGLGGTGSSLMLDTSLTKKGYAADAEAVGLALNNKLNSSQLQSAINAALEQAKQSGEFDGDDYILTDADKNEIARLAAELIDIPESGGGSTEDLIGYATQAWVRQNFQPKGEYVTSSTLESSVNDALAEAKANGDFKGETGATPNLTIGTVTTLYSGQKATATITGTKENPVLNLGIPRGADGAPGGSDGSGGSSADSITDEETLEFVLEMGYVTPLVDSNNRILKGQDNEIFVF